MTPVLDALRSRRSGTSGAARASDPRPVWLACSLLLDYPTERLVAGLDDVAALVPDDPHLSGVIAHVRETALGVLQREYVETFDHTRRCALYLTYFSYGDTRRRGMALVEFKEAYRRAGLEWDSPDLPDHLCAVLQLGATADAEVARRLLLDHRAGLEMLRLALAGWKRKGFAQPGRAVGSPWLGVVEAVCATLPTLQGPEAEAVRRLVEQGPPAEQVGLDTYGGPTLVAGPRIPIGAPDRTGGPR